MPKKQDAWIPFLACVGLAGLGELSFLYSIDFLWLLLPALLAFAAAGRILSRTSKAEGPDWAPSKGLEILLFALILLAALGLRLYNLDSIPEGAFRDEGQSGMVAAKMLEGAPIYDTGSSTPLYLLLVPAGFFYPMALIFKFLGVSLYSVRLDSVFFSILSIAAFYFLARRFFGVSLGLLLSFALAFLRWHLNFSRIGFLGIMTFFIQIPFAYYLVLSFQGYSAENPKKISSLLLWISLALALLRLGLSHFLYDSLGDNVQWLGLGFEIPGLICLVFAFSQSRYRRFILAAGILGLSFYTYAAAYLLVLLGLAWTIYAVLKSSAGLEPRQARLAGLISILFLVGLGVAAEGNALGLSYSLGFGWLLMGTAMLLGFWLLFQLRQRFLPWLLPLSVAALSFLILSGPMLDYYFSHLERVNSRPNRISIFQHDIPNRDPSWGHALELNVVKTLGMFNVRGDSNTRHNYSSVPMLNPLWAGLFALGLSLCFWEALSPMALFLLLWWQVTLLGGYFSIEAPQAYRCMDVMVPCLLIIGVAVERLWQILRRLLDPWTFGPILALLLFGSLGCYEVYLFFGPQAALPERWSAFSSDESQMGKDFRACPPNTVALLRPDWKDSYAFKFMSYPNDNAVAFDASSDVPLKRQDVYGHQNVLYILDNDSLPLRSVLEKSYPGGRYAELHHPGTGEFQYWSYFVPVEENLTPSASRSGLEGTYYADLGEDWKNDWKAQHWKPENQRLTRMDPFVLFHWTVAPIVERFYSVKWEGRLKAPQSGLYHFSTNSDDYTRLEIDGKKVLESPVQPFAGGWVEGGIKVLAGTHRIKLYYYSSKNTAHVELWWQSPKAQDRTLIPSEALLPPAHVKPATPQAPQP